MDAFWSKWDNENAEFILDFTSQAGDLETSVLSKQISKEYDMAENKMDDTKAAFDQSRAAMIKANSTMAQAKATAKANMAQQKANVMLGEIKKATG